MHERFHNLFRLRGLRLLGCLGLWLALSSSVKAEEVYLTNSSGIVITNTTLPAAQQTYLVVSVYMEQRTYDGLINALAANSAAYTAGQQLVVGQLQAIATNQVNETRASSQRTADVMAVYNGISGFMQQSAQSMGNIAQSLGIIEGKFSLFVPIMDQLRVATIVQVGKMAELNAGISTLNTTVNQFSTTVPAAIQAATVASTTALNATLGPKLDAIKDILLTNSPSSGSNNISITSTNGDISMTNVINVTIPDMVAMKSLAEQTLDGKAMVALNQAPDNYDDVRSTAQNSSPWQNLTILMPEVTVSGSPAGFMMINVPQPGGGVWSFDANPLTHAPQLVNGFRTAIVWATLLAFLFYCGKAAHDATANMGSANQTHSPDIAVLGNNTGLAIGITYVGFFLIAAAAFAAALAAAIDMSLFAQLGLNPFRDFGTDALILANMFLPLSLIISQAIFALSARWLLIAQSWIFNVFIRLLPA